MAVSQLAGVISTWWKLTMLGLLLICIVQDHADAARNYTPHGLFLQLIQDGPNTWQGVKEGYTRLLGKPFDDIQMKLACELWNKLIGYNYKMFRIVPYLEYFAKIIPKDEKQSNDLKAAITFIIYLVGMDHRQLYGLEPLALIIMQNHFSVHLPNAVGLSVVENMRAHYKNKNLKNIDFYDEKALLESIDRDCITGEKPFMMMLKKVCDIYDKFRWNIKEHKTVMGCYGIAAFFTAILMEKSYQEVETELEKTKNALNKLREPLLIDGKIGPD